MGVNHVIYGHFQMNKAWSGAILFRLSDGSQRKGYRYFICSIQLDTHSSRQQNNINKLVHCSGGNRSSWTHFKLGPHILIGFRCQLTGCHLNYAQLIRLVQSTVTWTRSRVDSSVCPASCDLWAPRTRSRWCCGTAARTYQARRSTVSMRVTRRSRMPNTLCTSCTRTDR